MSDQDVRCNRLFHKFQFGLSGVLHGTISFCATGTVSLEAKDLFECSRLASSGPPRSPTGSKFEIGLFIFVEEDALFVLIAGPWRHQRRRTSKATCLSTKLSLPELAKLDTSEH
ncbi:hypothetical protein C8Q78DRAFT_992929 [Trametes maxima]|nr:hypothetical protein C8Q78DRAFT_992929 [Trametes maxima]